MPEKRGISRLSESELRGPWRGAVAHEGAKNGKPTRADMLFVLQRVIDILTERASSSGITTVDLRTLNITKIGYLQLRRGGASGGWEEKLEAVSRSDTQASANLYDRLSHLQTLTPEHVEGAARAWTEAFFFRVYGMVLPSQTTAFSMEQPIIPPTIEPSIPVTLRGIIDHAAPIAHGSAEDTHSFFSGLTIEQIRSTIKSGLVVAETELPFEALMDDVPQLVLQMHGYAKALGRNVIRGALTTGDNWVFLILIMDPDGNGAKYWQSEKLGIIYKKPFKDPVVAPQIPDLITGLLAHWLNHSFEDISSDDYWFEPMPIRRY